MYDIPDAIVFSGFNLTLTTKAPFFWSPEANINSFNSGKNLLLPRLG